MKRITGAILGIVVTIVIISVGFRYSMSSAADISEVIILAENAADETTSRTAIEKAYTMWSERKNTMLIFSSHGKLNQIGESIRMARKYKELKDEKMFQSECTRALIYLDQFYSVEYPTISNIF